MDDSPYFFPPFNLGGPIPGDPDYVGGREPFPNLPPALVATPMPALDCSLPLGILPEPASSKPPQFLFGAGLFGQGFSFPLPPLVFESELVTYLKGKLGVKVYAGKIPGRRTLPALVYNIVDADSVVNLAGPAGLAFYHVQFDAYGRKVIDAAALLEALRKCLQPFRGQMGRATIRGVFLHNQGGGYTPLLQGTDDGTYRRMAEYDIWLKETTS